MTRENRKRDKSLYGSKSLLNMTLSLHLYDYLGWVIYLMVIIPMVYHTIHHFWFWVNAANSFSVADMFKRIHSVKSSFAILINPHFHDRHS